tara:strand:+ start:203 stop:355 length:153 start_codon:yes stop_codon:yes gene_type:complete
MKYTIVKIPTYVYEVHDENGEVVDDTNGNCFDSYEEALEVKLQAERKEKN